MDWKVEEMANTLVQQMANKLPVYLKIIERRYLPVASSLGND